MAQKNLPQRPGRAAARSLWSRWISALQVAIRVHIAEPIWNCLQTKALKLEAHSIGFPAGTQPYQRCACTGRTSRTPYCRSQSDHISGIWSARLHCRARGTLGTYRVWVLLQGSPLSLSFLCRGKQRFGLGLRREGKGGVVA